MSERREIVVDLDRISFDEGVEILERFGKKGDDGQPLVGMTEMSAFVKRLVEPEVARTLTLREGFAALQSMKLAFDELLGGDARDPKA